MFELLGARVYGSRTREGLYHDGSDVDVVLSYTGNIREDDFFHVLHEDGMEIAGLPLDINPISAEKTCSLEEYMETAEKYLDEKAAVQAEEKSTEIQPEPTITFYVAECSEYPILGEYHERLTLQEAAELYQKIPSDRINGLKEIGFRLEDGSIYDGNFGLMTAGKMQTEFINEIPQYRDSPLVQKAIADMEGILSAWKEAEQQKEAPEDSRRREDTELSGQAEKAALETGKTVEMTPKTDSSISAGSGRKQSVLKALRERQAKLKEQKPSMENWQKYYENGEYLRSAELTEEQNYNMIDGRINNLPLKPRKIGNRISVLDRLHLKQAEIERRSGKTMPQMAVAEDMERRRK